MPEWERVPLREVLVPVPASRRESVEPDKQYRLLGVRLNNEGAFLRETKKGSESSAPSLYRVEAGDFIYSRLFAWRGAFGLIPTELDGCYVSNEFPLFQAKDNRIDLEWLNFWFHLQDVIRTVEADCTGSTPLTRSRYKESFFLALEIPLPPLPEQQRIVARVKGLLAKVEGAQQLRGEVQQGVAALAWSIHAHAETEVVPVSDLVSLRPTDVQVEATENYHFAGVYSFGRGVFSGQTKLGSEFAYPRLTRLETGNFTYPKLMAWEGALGVVPPECNGLVVSTEFPVFRVTTDKILPEVLDAYFKNPEVWPQVSGDSTGTNVRRRRLNPSDFLAYLFPLPDRATQEVIAHAWKSAQSIKTSHAAEEELQALPASILTQAFAGAL